MTCAKTPLFFIISALCGDFVVAVVIVFAVVVGGGGGGFFVFVFVFAVVVVFDLYVFCIASANDSWVFLSRKNHGQYL